MQTKGININSLDKAIELTTKRKILLKTRDNINTQDERMLVVAYRTPVVRRGYSDCYHKHEYSEITHVNMANMERLLKHELTVQITDIETQLKYMGVIL